MWGDLSRKSVSCWRPGAVCSPITLKLSYNAIGTIFDLQDLWNGLVQHAFRMNPHVLLKTIDYANQRC